MGTGTSSADSSESSEGSLPQSSGEGSSSSGEEPLREVVPPTRLKSVDPAIETSVNFKMGSCGTEVMDDYDRPPPVTASTCTIPVDLLQRMITWIKAATMKCLSLAGSNKHTPTSSFHKTLVYLKPA